jgi:hypothetical protein
MHDLVAALTVTAETRHQILTLGLKVSWHSEIPLAHFCAIVNHIPREGNFPPGCWDSESGQRAKPRSPNLRGYAAETHLTQITLKKTGLLLAPERELFPDMAQATPGANPYACSGLYQPGWYA